MTMSSRWPKSMGWFQKRSAASGPSTRLPLPGPQPVAAPAVRAVCRRGDVPKRCAGAGDGVGWLAEAEAEGERGRGRGRGDGAARNTRNTEEDESWIYFHQMDAAKKAREAQHAKNVARNEVVEEEVMTRGWGVRVIPGLEALAKRRRKCFKFNSKLINSLLAVLSLHPLSHFLVTPCPFAFLSLIPTGVLALPLHQLVWLNTAALQRGAQFTRCNHGKGRSQPPHGVLPLPWRRRHSLLLLRGRKPVETGQPMQWQHDIAS